MLVAGPRAPSPWSWNRLDVRCPVRGTLLAATLHGGKLYALRQLYCREIGQRI